MKKPETKDAEIARLRAELEDLKTSKNFYSSFPNATDLIGFKIADADANRNDSMTLEDLGHLQTAFNGRFHYCLLVQPYMDNSLHGHYRLLAVYRHTDVHAWDTEQKRRLPREDEIAMRHFIAGFEAAVEASRRKD
jgi:hypothetical protein